MCYINHKTDLVFWGQNAFTSVSYTHVLGWPKSSLGFCKMLGKHPNELFGQPNIILNHMHNFDTSKIQLYFLQNY